jgi:flagellar biosynthesis/type III secretory pathway ATPase
MSNSIVSLRHPTSSARRHSYQVINSKSREVVQKKKHFACSQATSDLLRVIGKGPAVKSKVDDAIDQCAAVYNLRDSIEEERALAEQAMNELQKRKHAQKGEFASTCLAF